VFIGTDAGHSDLDQAAESRAELATAHPDIPRRDMRTMRNKLIQDYFDVDLDIV
jgi:uncharacterized protein with HEPN domain